MAQYMDPDANLARQRELVKQIDAAFSTENYVEVADAASQLVELISALDEWMSKGGYLPAAWADSYPLFGRMHPNDGIW
jgi:glycine/D-amino acid oxidase-like deaminating enzyme